MKSFRAVRASLKKVINHVQSSLFGFPITFLMAITLPHTQKKVIHDYLFHRVVVTIYNTPNPYFYFLLFTRHFLVKNS